MYKSTSKKIITSKIITSFLIMLLSMIIFSVSIVFAATCSDNPPVLPNTFSGTVKYTGVIVTNITNAPVGSIINAYVDYANDNTADGTFTVTTAGAYELGVTGCSTDNGKTINFTVDGVNANITATFSSSGPAPQTKNIFGIDAVAPNISYFSDTPVNASTQSNSTIIINVSVNDSFSSINTCILEWNGVNQTLTKNATATTVSCYIRNTSVSDGTYNYRVFANDSLGNMQLTGNRTVTIDTVAPNISYFSDTPVNASTQSNSTIIINVSVNDSFSSINTCILEWNGVNQTLTKNATATTVSCYIRNTSVSDGTYNYRVFANDSLGNMQLTGNRTVTISTSTGGDNTGGGSSSGGGSTISPVAVPTVPRVPTIPSASAPETSSESSKASAPSSESKGARGGDSAPAAETATEKGAVEAGESELGKGAGTAIVEGLKKATEVVSDFAGMAFGIIGGGKTGGSLIVLIILIIIVVIVVFIKMRKKSSAEEESVLYKMDVQQRKNRKK